MCGHVTSVMCMMTSILVAASCVRDCSSPPTDMESYSSRLEKFKATQVIKTRILGGLGYNDRPFPATSLKKSSACQLLNIVNDESTKTDSPKGDYYAELQEVISFSEPADSFHDDNIIQFKVVRDSQGRKLEVKSANVLVKLKYRGSKKRSRSSCKTKSRRSYVKKKHRRSGCQITIVLSTVGEDGTPGKAVTSLRADVKKTHWFKLGIPKQLVESAMLSKNQILKLHILCRGCRRRVQLVLVHGSKRRRKSKGDKRKGSMRVMRPRKRPRRRLSRTRPFLILHTKVETYIRSRRETSGNENTCTGQDMCCKSDLVFNFHEIGWNDWILYPASFTTGICSGGCPFVPLGHRDQTTLEHAHCNATQLAPLRMMYYDTSGSILTSSIPNMIVERCGCR
ncbi:inhibin beta A chain-like [Ylistrum balloti]|uniref:inhibin beta A chain-like n=1 Tax=Ylistrum balloti TaxID=509963 RepID=UPI002905E67A|nr:inhibin beta A chain-like [Ylistrum balloti]